MTPDDLLQLELVRALKLRYCDLCDRAELKDVADLFTEDGTCDLGPAFGGAMRGREGIRAGFGAFADMARPYGALHAVSNPVISLDGPDGASGTWYLHEFLLIDPTRPNPTLTVGIYHDTYARVAGSWLIATSRLEVLWPTGDPRTT